MAKRENMTEVSGGLSAGLDFGASREVKKAPVTETPVQAPVVATPAPAKAKVEGKALTDMYQNSIKEVEETRSKPFMVKLKPSTMDKMDKAVKKKIIKSRADLINFLLEQYFAELEEKQGK